MPPAAKTLFKKRVLDSQKFSIQGARGLQVFAAAFPISAFFFLCFLAALLFGWDVL
jgi:hypothetical protein